MLDDMVARANSVCLLALSRSDRRVLALLLVGVDCCAVLFLRCRSRCQVLDNMLVHTGMYEPIKKKTRNKLKDGKIGRQGF